MIAVSTTRLVTGFGYLLVAAGLVPARSLVPAPIACPCPIERSAMMFVLIFLLREQSLPSAIRAGTSPAPTVDHKLLKGDRCP